MATRRRKRQSKGVIVNIEGETASESEETVQQRVEQTEEAEPTDSTDGKKDEDQDDKDSQVDMVIEVKGSASTVTVTWDEKKDGKLEDKEKETGESDQITDAGGDVCEKGEQQDVSVADEVGSMEDAPTESKGTKIQQEVKEPGSEPEEALMDTTTEENERTPMVTDTTEMDAEEGESNGVEKEAEEGGEVVVNRKAAKRKLKPQPVQTSPSKKTKLINDGYCLFVGNLNNSKKFDEVKDSLANYFMAQSLLVQDIRVDPSKKYAHVDLASEMDLNKALTLNGETVLDKPLRIAKARVISAESVRKKMSPEEKKAAKDARSLFLKNIPYDATKEDIMKVFSEAIKVWFPDGAQRPGKGFAFVEFKNATSAEKIRQSKQVFKIQGQALIVDSLHVYEVAKEKENNKPKAEIPPNNVLYVSSFSSEAKEKDFKKVFKKAVSITVPQRGTKSKGCAFIEFASVADAKKALQSSKNIKICEKAIKLQFLEKRDNVVKKKVESKTLVVFDLSKKTTAESLKSAFEEALSARVIVDKETGVSKRFGFVEFESEEKSKSAKEAVEDCEIDGSKVTVAYSKNKRVVPVDGTPDSGEGCDDQPADQGAAKGGRARIRGKGAGAEKQRAVRKRKNKD
ncbi:nucleolin-like [Xyrichtys novacula]|uniref:Nucleolin-like n=1 Tax=Xyrichtys novacula TaxID=13765 RepID=A0AAV1GF62_XYRNO|nr:nucleolin-like [Xyrichtys novacula]